MLKAVVLPSFGSESLSIEVSVLHAREGDFIPTGGALVDLKVQFDAGIAYQCPPISHFRLLTREAGRLRRLLVAKGDLVAPEAALATIGDEADADPAQTARGQARVTLASIVPSGDAWWRGDA